jgi:hypothetical protein
MFLRIAESLDKNLSHDPIVSKGLPFTGHYAFSGSQVDLEYALALICC